MLIYTRGIVHQFWVYSVFSCLNKRNIFYKRFILIKQLWLEIIEHHFSKLFQFRVVLSRWSFYKKCFFRWDTRNLLYIQNRCTFLINFMNGCLGWPLKIFSWIFTPNNSNAWQITYRKKNGAEYWTPMIGPLLIL